MRGYQNAGVCLRGTDSSPVVNLLENVCSKPVALAVCSVNCLYMSPNLGFANVHSPLLLTRVPLTLQSSRIADISKSCVIRISLDNLPYKTSLAERVLLGRSASFGGKEAVENTEAGQSHSFITSGQRFLSKCWARNSLKDSQVNSVAPMEASCGYQPNSQRVCPIVFQQYFQGTTHFQTLSIRCFPIRHVKQISWIPSGVSG